jgi:hypothetical protein
MEGQTMSHRTVVPFTAWDLTAFGVAVAFLIYILAIYLIDKKYFWPTDDGDAAKRSVPREIWERMRTKYFANRKAGTRPPEGP